MIDRFGRLGPDVARGIKLRHDSGSQYRGPPLPGFPQLAVHRGRRLRGEPQGNAVAERFIRKA